MLHRASRNVLAWAVAGTLALAPPALAQEAEAPPAEGPIVSSQILLSREGGAELQLELQGGRRLDLALDEDGAVRMNGERIGRYERGDALYESWRDLLSRAMEAADSELAGLLVAWEPPDDAVARRLDRELETIAEAGPVPAPAPQDAPAARDAPQSLDQARSTDDSVRLLKERLRIIEEVLRDVDADVDVDFSDIDAVDPEEIRIQIERQIRDELRRELRRELREELRGQFEADRYVRGPLQYFTRGLSGVLSTLMMYAVLVGIGFLLIFFGRSYGEGVADTARNATMRSFFVGLASSFLVLPGYILGMIALAISIVGIPLLLVWIPLFPVAVVLAAVFGYLAVAHAAGESLAERRFNGGDWFKRANSYYYVMTGVGLLLVLYLAGHIIGIAGPWVAFLKGLLHFIAGVITWAAFTVGFGAVLISRGGTRPAKNGHDEDDFDLGEETRV